MCDLCAIQGREPYIDLRDGFFVAQAGQKDTRLKVEQGDWVLLAPGPHIIGNFGDSPRPDATEGMSDEQIEALDCEAEGAMWSWLQDAGEFNERLLMRPETGHALYEACEKLGYERQMGHLAMWLYHYVGVQVSLRGPQT